MLCDGHGDAGPRVSGRRLEQPRNRPTARTQGTGPLGRRRQTPARGRPSTPNRTCPTRLLSWSDGKRRSTRIDRRRVRVSGETRGLRYRTTTSSERYSRKREWRISVVAGTNGASGAESSRNTRRSRRVSSGSTAAGRRQAAERLPGAALRTSGVADRTGGFARTVPRIRRVAIVATADGRH